MKQYQSHVKDEVTSRTTGKEVSYCGANIKFEFHFTGLEHVLNARRNGDVLEPCPKCKKIIIDILNS